jgi:hypothetical protein
MWHTRKRRVYKVLVGTPEGKRSLGRPRRRWEDVIRNGSYGDWLRVWIGFDWITIGTGGELL